MTLDRRFVTSNPTPYLFGGESELIRFNRATEVSQRHGTKGFFASCHVTATSGEDVLLGALLHRLSCLRGIGDHAQQVDLEESALTFESLKKRKPGVFRSVPVPQSLIDMLDLVHGLRERSPQQQQKRLWSWSRMTAYRKIKAVMLAAGIDGIRATPKGLRHAFGIAANQKGIQLNMVQKWLGHADIKTTAIYCEAIGREERNVASRLWEDE